jgi:hypothetical protein
MEVGYVVIFENEGYRYPSGLVHRTPEAAKKAGDQPDRKGKPVTVIKIEWDDSAASAPWSA